MASAEHIKALFQSHLDGDDSHFFAVAMQVAAHEEKLGHGKLAGFPTSRILWKTVADCTHGLSFADIAKSCEDAIKDAIINDKEKVSQKDIARLLLDRKTNRPDNPNVQVSA